MIINGTYLLPLAKLSKTRESKRAQRLWSLIVVAGMDKRPEVVSDSDPGHGSEESMRLVICMLTACESLEVSLSE